MPMLNCSMSKGKFSTIYIGGKERRNEANISHVEWPNKELLPKKIKLNKTTIQKTNESVMELDFTLN